jgi:pSer/pThr/pTyr-binding forkhead associated (FHA) protein
MSGDIPEVVGICMNVRLVSVGGDVKATEISLQLPTLVGRGREATLTLPHPLVSRRHCELYELDGKLWVRDLGSLNGTYVGSQQVTDAEVPPGELLTVATLNFRVVYGDVPSDDEKESPLLVGSDDSTRGLERIERAPSGAKRPETPQTCAGPPDGVPVERDTEWQMGSIPPDQKPTDGEDLSSLLNGR